MYHVSAQGVDERMINYYYYFIIIDIRSATVVSSLFLVFTSDCMYVISVSYIKLNFKEFAYLKKKS